MQKAPADCRIDRCTTLRGTSKRKNKISTTYKAAFLTPTQENRNAAFFMPSCYAVRANKALIYAALRARKWERQGLISDILIRSISGYVFIVPVFILYFLYLKKSGRKQSLLHITAVFLFYYYLFGILTVTGIGYTSTISFRPRISLIPFLGMISGPIDTILNVVLFVPFGFFLPLLYKC